MKMKFTTSLPPSARPGLTLVEVLAALVLLGTILTGLVMAKSHHTRQLARTAERQTGIRLADQLITRWWTSPQGIPVDQRGAIDGDSFRPQVKSCAAYVAVGVRRSVVAVLGD